MRTTGRRRAVVVGVADLALTVSGVLIADAATPPPAHQEHTAGLKQVGPIDETNGYPLWYRDTNNVRLELCLDPDDANCIMGDLPHPGQPVSFPDNFPDPGGRPGRLRLRLPAEEHACRAPSDRSRNRHGALRVGG